MESLPKENQAVSGEITSGEIYPPPPPDTSENQPSVVPEISSSPDNFSQNLPPPLPENPFPKYLFLGIFFLFLLLLGFLAYKFFLKKKPESKPSSLPITLNYWGLWEEESVFKEVIENYQKTHPQVTIKYAKQSTKQYRERLQAAIKRGEGPDIFRFHNTWLPLLINELAPLPKEIYSEEEFSQTFYPVAKEDLKFGDQLYGIPLEIDGLMLLYNEDILKSANVPVPSTWVEVQEAVFKLTVKEKEKIITSALALGTAENIEHFSDILGLMMLQNGTKLSSSLFSCLDERSENCAVDVLKFFHQFAETGTPYYTWNETMENSILAFATGKVAMIFAPSWQIFTILEIAKNSNVQLNLRTAPFPQLPCSESACENIYWATYWVEGVSKTSKNQLAAWEFLKYLSRKEIMQKLYEEEVKIRKLFGEPYSRRDLAERLSDHPYLAPIIKMAPEMKSFYLASRTHDGETGLNTTLINYLKDAVNSLSQGVSPETALKTANQGFQQIFERFQIASFQR